MDVFFGLCLICFVLVAIGCLPWAMGIFISIVNCWPLSCVVRNQPPVTRQSVNLFLGVAFRSPARFFVRVGLEDWRTGSCAGRSDRI